MFCTVTQGFFFPFALCMYLWKNTTVRMSYMFKNSSSCTVSPSPFCLYLWSLIVTSKSSIQHHPLQLPLSLASRCRDLFSGCLNRLAVIKSYAPLMTLSWGKAPGPEGGKRRLEGKEGRDLMRKGVCPHACVCFIVCVTVFVCVPRGLTAKRYCIWVMEVQTNSWKKRGGNNGERAMGRACNGLIRRAVHGGDSEPVDKWRAEWAEK